MWPYDWSYDHCQCWYCRHRPSYTTTTSAGSIWTNDNTATFDTHAEAVAYAFKVAHRAIGKPRVRRSDNGWLVRWTTRPPLTWNAA